MAGIQFLTIDEIRNRFPHANGYQVRSWIRAEAFSGICNQGIWFVLDGALRVTFDERESVTLHKGEFAGFPVGHFDLEVLGNQPVEYVVVTQHGRIVQRSKRSARAKQPVPPTQSNHAFGSTYVSLGHEPSLHPRSPEQLENGLGFEDNGLLIPWGTPTKELAFFDSVKITHRKNRTFFYWEDRVLFGLRCIVRGSTAAKREDTISANNPHKSANLDEFHRAVLTIYNDWGEKQEVVEAGFRKLFSHLESAIGPPSFCYPDYYRGLPSFSWKRNQLKIRFSYPDRNGPQISIAHDPDGYEELKTDAEKLREQSGRGARVEYVDFDW